MTKVRPPFTFENALSTVAGHIGWARVAEITGKAETTCRNWSDHDTTASVTLKSALRLDEEFHNAGGNGTPFLLCYATQLEAAKIAASPELAALIASAAKSAKECGEAVSAILCAATPRASLADFAIAERELEEAITAQTNSLAALRARREALREGQGSAVPEGPSSERSGDGTEAEPSARAEEVAPPMQTV